MNAHEKDLRCDGCGIEIRWRPVFAGKLTFCCRDCLYGRACECQDRLEIEDDRREDKSSLSSTLATGDYAA